jgi:hypothetical protein
MPRQRWPRESPSRRTTLPQARRAPGNGSARGNSYLDSHGYLALASPAHDFHHVPTSVVSLASRVHDCVLDPNSTAGTMTCGFEPRWESPASGDCH